MKHLHVTCAIIERAGLVLAARRSAEMSHPLKWEFPGGKIQAGESPEECLIREIAEELAVQVSVKRRLQESTHNYPQLSVTLYPFICSITSGEIIRREHSETVWLPPAELQQLDWAEADLPVLSNYLTYK